MRNSGVGSFIHVRGLASEDTIFVSSFGIICLGIAIIYSSPSIVPSVSITVNTIHAPLHTDGGGPPPTHTTMHFTTSQA